MKLAVLFQCLAISAILTATLAAGDDAPQRVPIPAKMPEGGRMPSFKIMVEGVEAGRVHGDAVLSNGRFFGIR